MLCKLRKRFYKFRKFSKLSENWAYCLANTFDTQRKKKFVIFGQGRAGSTLLVSLLHQHPNIYCDNELLQKKVAQPIQYFEGRSLMNLSKHYGFKVNPYQIMDFLDAETSRHFIGELFSKGWQIIYLRRRNWFRHALSNEIAKQRGYFFKDASEFEQAKKVVIDPYAFRRAIEARVKFWKDEQATLDGLDYLELVYEDHLLTTEKREQSLPEICGFLGINPDFKPEVPFLRSTTDDLSALIENYEEVVKVAEKYGVEVY